MTGKIIVTISIVLFFTCNKNNSEENHQAKKLTTNKIESSKSDKIRFTGMISSAKNVECTLDGELRIIRHIHPVTKKLENDKNGRAIIEYEYNESGKIERIIFRQKDSSYCEFAFIEYKYDNQNRLKQEKFLDPEKREIWESKNYFYNKKNQVEKIVKVLPKGVKYGSRPGMVKFTYDKKGRISKEEYFSSEGGNTIVGEMGIKYIAYKYGINGLLKESTFHYTGTTNINDEPKKIWVNEYLYDTEDRLIESRYKFDINQKDYDNITYFRYDEEKKMYGKGEKIEHISTKTPYCNIKNVVYQELYSDFFHTHPKKPNLRD